MTKRRKQSEYQYPADLVWGAACAAYRINAGYLKYPEIVEGRIVKPTNRELVRLYLADDGHQYVTAADGRQGALCQQTLKNSVTMAALKGELSEWNLLVARMTALDTVESDYELSVIAALPRNYDQILAR